MPVISEQIEHLCNSKREGFYGWMGFGGSVLQWNPDLQLGIGYVPADLFNNDFVNYRASLLQSEAALAAKS